MLILIRKEIPPHGQGRLFMSFTSEILISYNYILYI
nr:MAG TPA: hypothetical protein [Caudoviricetes sp.]